MADALISPLVGCTMWVATAGVAAYSVKKLQNELDEKKIPLMGVMGAFVFAAQMINFMIPGTGSSGHIGGGILLSILLGPLAGFLTMASILFIQALFFADGGLLAFGCNVINMGFFSCFVAFPWIFKSIIRKGYSTKRIFIASVLSTVIGLQLGAFSVVMQTFLSGKTELPLGTFILLMQPIHLAIGFVEGLITSAVVVFVWKARPEIIESSQENKKLGSVSMKKVLTGFIIAVLVMGGGLSWFASSDPDGLEWSISKVTGTSEVESKDKIHEFVAQIQSKTAFLPDYGFKTSESEQETTKEAWPSVNAGTSVSGIMGGILTLVLAGVTGLILTMIKKKRVKSLT